MVQEEASKTQDGVKKLTQEEIESFLRGKDPTPYIISIECGYQDDTVYIIRKKEKDGKKIIQRDQFRPFCWATYDAVMKLNEGFEGRLKQNLSSYGIRCKQLRVRQYEGQEVDRRLIEGYRFLFQAIKAMSYSDFLKFFEYGKCPIYSRKKNDGGSKKKYYLTVSPVEQYMIYTGKRMFKGYESYDELLRLTFDLETEGLDPNVDAINQIGIRTNKGYEKILTVVGNTKEEREASELYCIREFLRITGTEIKPDIFIGHNSENFDWNFIIVRLSVLGTSMEEESALYFPKQPIYKQKKQAVLKLGGEIEYYNPTIIWGFNVIDSLHPVRRAQALDSNMKKADLKYVTRYSKLNKPNRVYVPGEIIGTTWLDETESYAFNNDNGKWFKVDDSCREKTIKVKVGERQSTNFTDEEIESAKNRIKEIEEELRSEAKDDEEFEELKKTKIPQTLLTLSEGNIFEPIYDQKPKYTFNEDGSILDNSDGTIYPPQRVTGRYIVERYLLDDLYETDKVELKFNTANFLIAQLLPTTFTRASTMGTAGIWKMLAISYLYENDLCVPQFGESQTFTGGLSRLLCVGKTKKVVKLDYNSLYPSTILTYDIESCVDVTRFLIYFLEYILLSREKFKKLKKQAGKAVEAQTEKINAYKESGNVDPRTLDEMVLEAQRYEAEYSSYDNSQLVFKQLANSFFGSFGAPYIFPLGDINAAEEVTCTGRQMLRLMISWFKARGYKPIVGDTDGFNFEMPSEELLATRHYIGKGLSREVKEGKEYFGVEADVAEFNDLYMRKYSGLGIDEYAESTINFKRKTYCDMLSGGKVKVVGNTIKSKKMPAYIEKFLDENLRILLEGKGSVFLNNYYDYIEKIYNLRIPLQDIASKGKIKKSIEDYKQDCNTFTSAGQKKSRQAWYELAIKAGINPHMGETVYYINTGVKKSHTDIKRITHYYTIENGTRTEITKEVDKRWNKMHPLEKEHYKTKRGMAMALYSPLEESDTLEFNCVMLDKDMMESETEYYCSDDMTYNVEKYIDMFNKRIKSLMVCFNPEIRDNIIISNPKNRRYFTQAEAEMVSGFPMKPTDQDDYDVVMTMEDKEIRFWTSVGKVPPFVKECGIPDWEEIKKDYLDRMAKMRSDSIKREIEVYESTLEKMTSDDIDAFINNGKIPKGISTVSEFDPISNRFMSKTDPEVPIGNIYDILNRKYQDKYTMDSSERRFYHIEDSQTGDTPDTEEKLDDITKLTVKDTDEDDTNSSESDD